MEVANIWAASINRFIAAEYVRNYINTFKSNDELNAICLNVTYIYFWIQL